MPKIALPTTITSPQLQRFAQAIIFSVAIIASLAFHHQARAQIGTAPIQCPNEQEIIVPNAQTRLITNNQVRDPNKCIRPTVIFVHATDGVGLDGIWGWFNQGAQGSNVNSHFIVGANGTIIQTTKLYSSTVEFARTNDPYNNYSIAIEMEYVDMEFPNKEAVPAKQWQATLDLVAFLMNQYNIPMGVEYDHLSPHCFSDVDPEIIKGGVFSHYQIGPDQGCGKHTDIGKTTFKAFREDLAKLTGLSGSSGNTLPSGSGGRMVPYDKYARPYSWPMSGTIKQEYGFTQQAQNLGQRYPGLYPMGDPNVTFSTTNHIEPPLDATISRFINPNIDIAPSDTQASSRAVYATHAGWITFAGWAGVNKGYTIQIESDVEGDGQSDLATRYMRLQPPQNGQFAPDIDEYYPEIEAISNPTQQNPAPLEFKVPPMQTLEAEDMTISGTTQDNTRVVDDSQASSGQAILITDGATLTANTNLKADVIKISARMNQGSILPGCNQVAQLSIRTSLGDLGLHSISSQFYRSIEIPVEGFDGSDHSIGLNLANPSLLCNMQLWIDRIDYIITDPTKPTIETVSKLDVQAEDLTDVTEGNQKTTQITDNLAGGSKYVAFTSNSTIEGTIQLPTSNYISMRARATFCGDQLPFLTVKLDGQMVWQNSIRHTDWQTYSAELQMPGTNQSTADTNPDDQSDQPATTEHLLSIEFSNDEYQSPLCDRNIDLDLLTFTNYQVTQATTSTTSLIGRTKYVARDQLIGYVSESRGNEQEWAAFQEQHALNNPTDEDKDKFLSLIPNATQSYLSYRIMYNNPNMTTFPSPILTDTFINAKVDNPYIIETPDNTVAGNLHTILDRPDDQMYFFCAHRITGNTVRCINQPNP